LVLAGVVAIIVASVAAVRLLLTEDSPGEGWVRVGAVQDIRAEGVVSLPDVPAYTVLDPPRTPITFLARSPQNGERIRYCPSSGWFEDPIHGSKFDRLGNYRVGPAPRGLDRLATLVQDGAVWVNPNEITLGPARGSDNGKPPAGPFCLGGD
jgi:hypothetical protein